MTIIAQERVVNSEQVAEWVYSELQSMFDRDELSAAKLFEGGGCSFNTRMNLVLRGIAHKFGWEFAVRGCGDRDHTEWLYDAGCHRSGEEQEGAFYLLRQYVAMECEYTPHEVIDDDFQKLPQARADVRIWASASRARHRADAERRIANCKKQVRLFHGTQPGDRYILLFLYYDGGTPRHLLLKLRADDC